MVQEKVEQIIMDIDNLIFEMCEKYEVTTISAVAAISARLYAITKEEYPEHDSIGLLDKVVDKLMDVIETSNRSPKDSVQSAPKQS